MTTVTFRTEPFTCPSCIRKIEGAVGRMDGVREVTVRFNSSKVMVTFDESVLEDTAIAGVITGLGYPVIATSGGRRVAHA